MRRRRVLLCLPDHPSEDVLALAQAIKTTLERQRPSSTRFHLEESDDDDKTPVEIVLDENPLVLRIEEPPDGGERSEDHGDEDHHDC